MKARKKAGVIEVQQYHAEEVQAWPSHVRFREGSVAERPAVWNEPQQTYVGVNDGDYIRIDNLNDVYPISAEYFAENYEVI